MRHFRLAITLLALAVALPAAAQLRIIDLGPAVSPGAVAFSRGWRLNDSDQVIGYGNSSGGYRCVVWSKWNQADLGNFGGGDCQVAAINAAGVVVGTSKNAAGQFRGFIWRGGAIQDLGALYDQGVTWATDPKAINAAGQVAGWGAAGSGDWSGFLWEAGSMVRVGGWQSYGMDVNALGQVAGYGAGRAFLWSQGELSPIDNPVSAGMYITARKVNDAGMVIGEFAYGGFTRGYRWHGGEFVDLGTFGGEYDQSWSAAIDAEGRVAGTSSANRVDYGFLWEDGVMTNLGANFYPSDIGPGRLVVGNAGTRAAIWKDGQLTDLGTLGGGYAQAWDVNALGHVVGESTTASGEMHAVLWTDRSTGDLLGDLIGLASSLKFPKKAVGYLTSAQAALAAGKTASACSSLASFTSWATAQSGKSIGAAQAQLATIGSGNISRLAGCP